VKVSGWGVSAGGSQRRHLWHAQPENYRQMQIFNKEFM
jgi:hypothetical protein